MVFIKIRSWFQIICTRMYQKIILFLQKYLAFLPFVILISMEETVQQKFPGLLGEYVKFDLRSLAIKVHKLLPRFHINTSALVQKTISVSDNLDVKISKEPYTSFMQMLRIYKTISKDMWTIFNKNSWKFTLVQLSVSQSEI